MGLLRFLFPFRAIVALLTTLRSEINRMSQALQHLAEEVARNRDVTASAVVLINGLRDELHALVAEGDLEGIAALAESLDAQTSQLAAAVALNTEHPTPAPTPAPAPEPVPVDPPAADAEPAAPAA